MNLYGIIQQSFFGDDCDPDKVSQRLKDYYNECNQMEQSVINNIFIELIGWSFETLLEMESGYKGGAFVEKDCKECLNEGKKDICDKCCETSGGRPSMFEAKDKKVKQ